MELLMLSSSLDPRVGLKHPGPDLPDWTRVMTRIHVIYLNLNFELSVVIIITTWA
jgi:hypothetical protein